jgi:single-strand DNA-binding protein
MKIPYKNLTIFAGYIGNEPELRYLPSGDETVSLRIKSQYSYRDKASGSYKHIDEWATAVFYRQIAKDVVEQGAKKGRFIHVEGRRHTRQYPQEGRKPGIAHEILVDDWHFVAIANQAQEDEPAREPPNASGGEKKQIDQPSTDDWSTRYG